MKEKLNNNIVFKQEKTVPIIDAKEKTDDGVKNLSDILKDWKENKEKSENKANEISSDLINIIESKGLEEKDELKAFEFIMQLMAYRGAHNLKIVKFALNNILKEQDEKTREAKLGIFGSRFQRPTLTREMAEYLGSKKGKGHEQRFLGQFANTAEALKEIAVSLPDEKNLKTINFAKLLVSSFSEDKPAEEIVNKMRDMADLYRGDPTNLTKLLPEKKKDVFKKEKKEISMKESGFTSGRGFANESVETKNLVDYFYNNIEVVVKKERISPKKFEGKYGKQEVEDDIRNSEHLNKTQEERHRRGSIEGLSRLAAISEFLFYNLIKKEKIFGDDFSAHLPALYDDQKNKADVIVEYKRKNIKTGKNISNDAFVVDMVMDISGQVKKMDDLIKEIKENKLSKIKYFSPMGGEIKKGDENRFPRLILKMDDAKIDELMDLYEKKVRTEQDARTLKKISDDISEQLLDFIKKITASPDIPTVIKSEYNVLGKALIGAVKT